MIIPNIFVEGDADMKFVKDYFYFLFEIELNNIQKTGGWTQLSSEKNEGERIRNSLKRNTANGEINLIIFDADEHPKERRKEIENWKTKYKLEFELFLFPNNKEAGELEDLLERIIPENNLDIIKCWSDYENCLKTKSKSRTKALTIPAKKSKIYCYLEALVGKSNSEKEKIKDKKRNFLDTEHWQLSSEKLEALKNFLEKYFNNKSG